MNDEIKLLVEESLFSYAPLRESFCPISVEVKDGRVELKGVVRSLAMKEMATRLAWKVKGVKEVINNLLVDSQLEEEVAMRLAADPQTRPWARSIRVQVIRGQVRLKGQVPPEVRDLIKKVAEGTPGVFGVEFDERAAPV
ncbi:MAG: BON domain-containing protein [Anaerolineae bacterium]|nr:BON domain-containing protein [Anaerolineae bacterium]MDW8102462.1 BON domain-containing protein [Anaerolineae bacterium]